jgi:hypothetical protein
MTITWTPEGSETPRSLQDLGQVADLLVTELRTCRQAVEHALGIVDRALAVTQLFEKEASRFRHDRVSGNIKSVTHV